MVKAEKKIWNISSDDTRSMKWKRGQVVGFNEKVHAYIAAKYYVYLKEHFDTRGLEAFQHATRYYAEQRGRRMAQRAIRDGQPLTYETYCRYGEWVNTEEVKALGEANRAEKLHIAPDSETHIYVCPWHSQFKEMGLPEAGIAYCRDLDASICRGFNPEIDYRTTQTLHDHACCIQIVKNSGLKENGNYAKRPEGLKSFEYHCAHSYWSYREAVEGIFGREGEQIGEAVLADFAADYGKEMADILFGYRHVNFNTAD